MIKKRLMSLNNNDSRIPLAVAHFPEQPKGFNLFSIPPLRRFVRWKYARAVFQIPLLILAIFVIVDGFTGRQLAPRNIATTSVWLHYRGLVVLALAFFGNAFCAACPLMLTRGISRQLDKLVNHKFSFPKALKNKYLVIVLMLLYFFSYEFFDLWASPWLTAWLAIGYFGSALVIDTLFPAGTFCKYVCPLGNFNFVVSGLSPTQITAVNTSVCESCVEKPCLHGRESYDHIPHDHISHDHIPSDTSSTTLQAAFIPLSSITSANGTGFFPGCETNLYVPTMTSNMDCTSCFNCVRACPYDNVALSLRAPTWEFSHSPWAPAQSAKQFTKQSAKQSGFIVPTQNTVAVQNTDNKAQKIKHGKFSIMLLGVLLTYYGLMNAIAMVPQYYQFADWLALNLNLQATPTSEAILLALFLAIIAIVGLVLTGITSYLADLIGFGSTKATSPHLSFMRWGYVSIILGVGFWTAHYIFHFLTGALTIIPVFEHFFSYRGFDVDPNWRLSKIVPTAWLFAIGAAITVSYTILALYTTLRIAFRDFGNRAVLAMWPILIYVLFFAAFTLLILAQPMEMRGTIFGPNF